MKKTKLSFIELFKGVPMFQKVLTVLESKQFVDAGMQKIGDDIIIGVMSPLERACYTVLQQTDQKISALTCPVKNLNANCLDKLIVKIGLCPLSDQLLAIKKEYPHQKDIRNFMFGLITSRLKKICPDIENVKLCEGFRLTTSTKITAPETIEKFASFNKRSSMEKMLENSFKNTFMEPVFEILKKGEFIAIDKPIKDGEVFVREMNDFEKALWSYFSQVIDISKAKSKELETILHESLGSAFDSLLSLLTTDTISEDGIAEKNKIDALTEKTNLLLKESDDLKSILTPMTSLVWNILKSNIPDEKLEVYDATGVRDGFKVVVFDE